MTANNGTEEQAADVVVVGAGLIGATLAAALGSAGVRVAVIDRLTGSSQVAPTFDGRTTAIAHGSQRALETIGVWRFLGHHAQPILDIRISDGRLDPTGGPAPVSPLHLHFDHRQAARPGEAVAPMGHIVENRHIRAALFRRLEELPAVSLLAPAELSGAERSDNEARVVLADGRAINAALLVSAEGRGGMLREQAGIRLHRAGYGQTAIVVTAEHALPHRGVAQEKFLPAGPFAILPMTDDPATGAHRSSIVWTERAELVPALLRLSEAAFQNEFARRFGEHLGAVKAVGPRFSYPLSVQTAERLVAPRLALVGDAAHGIHPIAGQGWNLGLRDVAALAEIVVDAHRLGLDVGHASVLADYERWRRVDGLAMIGATDGLNRLFSNDVLPLRLVRDVGLAAVNRMPPLRRFFMRHAMGLIGDLPRLIKGEAL
ncbi:UbiH/UbiF/VisC/COQ6 family ubiquinone biosynthesis hydroxylase [Reyranella sp. CPCC 100927]|uniref:UbiH/UbiF/VisC/COQ6 family ubiquinone biosynthesis hydroxylase n=1 Tax=Reyranella sp. CPCC 100927 TaxID=2599616 RepID=UPI0011B531F2|nr:UbiH/UbiF/VisC/COQ6 family ubiquinone biosynthesis hydroxylase [Reyranella sp. CPCC 100927]TWT02574.1 2-octaprenyl-6-methoxyphenyl hydroxylase [Reyranella sp. CPCC 100927]